MDEPKKPKWGITHSISEAPPTEADNKLNDNLIETLTRLNVFETLEGNKRREEVLAHVQKVVEEFVRRAGKLKGIAQSTLDVAGGKIFFFGSYALGVHGPTSDIDTLIVVPKHVFIEDFFKIFPSIFRELSNAEDISELVPVEDAYVPIIKMEYRGVSLDLLFASMPTMSSVPKELETVDKSVLRHLEETTIRSVNGTRVVKELLSSVPQRRHFRYALRAVKLWANRRAIYGAVFGYPGGIAWAIMVARICQLYPMACGATILSKFFNLMHKWQWPRPVMLKEHELPEFGLRVWNPASYPPDARHLMPVITPAFPAMCSTHTVTTSTKQIMMEEFQRADKIVRDVFNGQGTWEALFNNHSFFTQDHKYYLSVIAASRTKEADLTFHGLVQSKVRLLVAGIDDGQTGIDMARPFPEGFERVHRCKNEDEVEAVTKGSLDYMIPVSQVPSAGTTEDHIIYTMTFYIGLRLPKERSTLDISYITNHFRSKITESKLYDEGTMSVKVVHTRNTALPDDLFKPGEVRPAKAKSTKDKKKSKGGAKRPHTETGFPDSEQQAAKRRQTEPAANGVVPPTAA
ncbi:poly-A polymerase [Parastagonospora nodorum]|nr:poly-A polymerase [Parastagonospora nodorum]KAH3965355.1 poly-A polymerase [Parastagonospora nodorum]KAH3977091.1 poly-A polymerase [Parastagonospora nodorum]KAH4103224.1 poly-A polymerase [Parastagonospora nodorum]KAH4121334.1 poly-A polymerase [Parastagonospora nodorum]